MISQNVIDRIQDLDIITVIENEGVHLTKKGVDYECCCPFHGEKTPSFKVSIKRNRYHCFGCNADGDSINFIMETKHMKFYEAVEYLADKYDIPYEKEEPSAEEPSEEPASQESQEE